MGVSILSIAVLSSCQKDEFIGNVIEKTTTYTMTAEINNNSDSRATVNENMEFLWHAHDALSVYDNTNNFKFSTINYFDDKQSNKAEFVGDAAFTDGTSEVTVIYPYKETDPTVLELPAEIEQTSDVPELKNTMFMAGKGKLNGNKIEEVTLNHLTALYHFKIKNVTGRMLKLKEVSVEADENIFPLKLTYSENSTSENKTNKLSIKFNDKEFADGNEINAYMNIFPTGDIKNKTLAFKVIGTDEENKERKYEALKGSVSALYPSTFTSYQKGKRYVVNLEITGDKEAGPDEGYDIDAEGKYHIYNAKGLMAWKAAVDVDKTTNAVLEKNIDMSNQDNWTPIAEFSGIFDGNNKEISRLSSTAANIITLNRGTIKSLSIVNLNITGTSNGYAGFVAKNIGSIENIIVKSINMDVQGKIIGGLIGLNENTIINSNIQSGTIKARTIDNGNAVGGLIGSLQTDNGIVENCTVGGEGNLTITISAKNTESVNAGGLIGQTPNAGSKQKIKGSAVLNNTSVTVNNDNAASNIGGFIGWHASGSIDGCYALTKLVVHKGSVGGFIGQSQSPNALNVSLCYSSGQITSKIHNSTNEGGFIGKSFNTPNIKIIGCYTTTFLETKSSSETTFKLGGMQGDLSGSTLHYNESYYTVKIDALGISTVTADGLSNDNYKIVTQLKELTNEMNNATTDSEYEFVKNESDTEPLIIKKK